MDPNDSKDSKDSEDSKKSRESTPDGLNELEKIIHRQKRKWECPSCGVFNEQSICKCKACECPRPGHEEKSGEENGHPQLAEISSSGFSFTPIKATPPNTNGSSQFSLGSGGFNLVGFGPAQPSPATNTTSPGFSFSGGGGTSGNGGGGFAFTIPESPVKTIFSFGADSDSKDKEPSPQRTNFFSGPFTPGTSQKFKGLTVNGASTTAPMDVDDGKERSAKEMVEFTGHPDSSDEEWSTSDDEETNDDLADRSFRSPMDRKRAHKFEKFGRHRQQLRQRLETHLSDIAPGTSVVCATGDGSINGVLGLGCGGDMSSGYPRPIPTLFQKRVDVVVAGAMSCAALTDENELYVWGSNEHGELGENPLDVPDLGDENELPEDRKWERVAEEYKRRMIAIYKIHAEEKLGKIDEFVANAGTCERMYVLYERICKKYHLEVEPEFKPKMSPQEKEEMTWRMLNPAKYLADVTDEREFARRASCLYWTPARMRIPPEVRVAHIDFGAAHVVILDEDGIVYSMGTFNSDGLVGHHYDEARSKVALYERQFFRVNDLMPNDPGMKQLRPIRQIACGANHFLMLDDNGEIYQMGVTQLGQRTSPRNQKLYLRPHQVPSIMHRGKRVKYTRIRCGDHHNMAISTTSELFAWGQNNFWQCGVKPRRNDYNSVVDQPRHVKFSEQINVMDVQCGQHFSVMLDNHGRVWSFGRNACNQLGRKTSRPSRKNVNGHLVRQECEKDFPRVVPNLDEIDLISAGGTFWFARSKMNRRKVVTFGFSNLGCCGVGNWHAAGGRCVFDETILPDDFYVSGISGSANHSMFLLERIDPNGVERVSMSERERASVGVGDGSSSDGSTSPSGGTRKKRTRFQMERDSTSPPDLKSPPKKSQRTESKKVASRTKSRRQRRRRNSTR